MIYYLIQAYKKDVDETHKGHLYPSYVTSYKMQKGGDNFGLQSGIYDALKFLSDDTANEWKEIAVNAYPDREFEVVPLDGRILGRVQPRFVVEDGYVGVYGHAHSDQKKIENGVQAHQSRYQPKTFEEISAIVDEMMRKN